MRLVQRSLCGRAFLLQFMQIMEEFGDEIPWLEPLKGISYTTNGAYFRDQFIKGLGLKEEESVTVFQFVTPDREHQYVGGVIHFAHVPESFRDKGNQKIQSRLLSEGYHFISCLQVRDDQRGKGYGYELMRRALISVLNEHGKVWGVVSNPRLVTWYKSLGANLQSAQCNSDNLWIISWN